MPHAQRGGPIHRIKFVQIGISVSTTVLLLTHTIRKYKIALGIVAVLMHNAMDDKSSRVAFPFAVHHQITLKVDLDQVRGGDFVEHCAKWVQQKVVVRAGYAGRKMGKDQIIPTVMGGQSIGRREVNPHGPFFWRHLVAHG